MATCVKFSEYGDTSVLKLENETVGSCGANDVVVDMLFSSISPGDIQALTGSYSTQSLPAVAGSQGVGVVTSVGGSVKGFNVGDHVVPIKSGLGTWSTELKADASALQVVPKDMPLEFAAGLASPCAAYRMLNDFVSLKEGDVIVQNGANGSVGLAVIQLAKAAGIKTVNIMRNRPDWEDLSEAMQNIGADIVVPDTYARTPEIDRLLSDVGDVKLGLNCVGGNAFVGPLLRALQPGSTLVTYGAMAGNPALNIPASSFIYKNLSLKGFSLESWMASASLEERSAMIEALKPGTAGTEGGLHLWLETRPFSAFNDAIKRATQPYVDRKVVMDMKA
jgi:trans-2-enoyl-CoA reductase